MWANVVNAQLITNRTTVRPTTDDSDSWCVYGALQTTAGYVRVSYAEAAWWLLINIQLYAANPSTFLKNDIPKAVKWPTASLIDTRWSYTRLQGATGRYGVVLL